MAQDETILIVDDEKEIADLLEVYLKNDSYTVLKCHNAKDALACIAHENISLALLDVMLPDMDGFSLCQKIRESCLFPIIMLTAKVEDMDKITGLSLGADDYITKPFNPLEVVARIKTQIRRYKQYNTVRADSSEPTEYDSKGLYICPDSHRCTLNGEEMPLTPIEFDILWYLCKNHGRVIPAEELFEAIWGEKFLESNNNTVMAHIARLREKMHEPARKPKYIKTVWGLAMSLKNRMADNQTSYKKTAMKTAWQYLAVLFIVEAVLIALNLLFLAFIDQTGVPDLVAAVHNFYRVVMIPFFIVVSVFICAYITYRFMLRPLHYLDDVAQAAAMLAHPTEAPITLSTDLKNIEDDLNSVREQTLESLKAAQESEKKKNDLLVYLAHDLKTPLTSVIGYLKLIEDKPTVSPELISKYAGIAHTKADRLEELINEFFEITRFSTSKLTLNPESTNLSRMLMQITYEFKPILAGKELEWDLQIPENIEIRCDPDKLERALDNLIRNAVNYCFEKTAILFSLAKTESGVKICIQNKGQTIPPEKLKRIFEQFYRLDAARSGDTGGAGLGLAIAKEIVELHHGTIAASSADETIRFEILLPNDCQKIV